MWHIPGIDWKSLHGLMQTVAYGGHIDNDYDMKVLNVYLKRYFNSSIIGMDGVEIVPKISLPLSSNITVYLKQILYPCDTVIFPMYFFNWKIVKQFFFVSLNKICGKDYEIKNYPINRIISILLMLIYQKKIILKCLVCPQI